MLLPYSAIFIQIQMEHEPHIAKPKIAKNASSKLPEVFRVQASSSKRPLEPVQEQKHQSQPKVQGKEGKESKERENRKGHKSKNPFLPIKEFIKKAEEFAKEMRDANHDFNANAERLSRYSFEGGLKDKVKIKYENCITLSIVRRNGNSCLKKVLHVPTLTVHFLLESTISAHFDKAELNDWIALTNKTESHNCIKILELFWNMPEDSYSMLYEYSEGLLLDSLNESLHTLPLALLRDIAVTHFSSVAAIYSSLLILHEEGGAKVIKYLPLYEESDFMIGEVKKIKEITSSELGAEDVNFQTNSAWKLGLILLNGYLGSVVLSQDLEKVAVPLKKCCLLHEILSTNPSLSALFLSLNAIQDEALCDFLCKCLRSRKYNEKQSKIQSKVIRSHKFLTKKYGEIISLGEVIQVVDPSSNIKSKFQISKMNKIMDSVSLILQNVSEVEAKITPDNREVVWLARQLGMGKQIDKVIVELKKVYKGEKV